MNREDIIRMARESGATPYTNRHYPERPTHTFNVEQLERFAALVAGAERKAMMQLFTDPENQPTQHGTVTVDYMQREIAAERNSWPAEMEAMERQVNILTDALAQAKAEEREACAKIVEESSLPDAYSEPVLLDIADDIRARGQA